MPIDLMKNTYPHLSDELCNDYLKLRKEKKAPLTATAWNRIVSEIEKSGWTPEDALSEAMMFGWQGLKAEWLKRKPQTKQDSRAAAINTIFTPDNIEHLMGVNNERTIAH